MLSTVMFAGQVESWFIDVSNSTDISYRYAVTPLIFKSIGLQHQSNLTSSGSDLSIVKLDSIKFKYYKAQLDQFDA